MHILVLNYEYPPLGGGGGIACKKYAEGWVRLGHEVTVVTSHFMDLPFDCIEDGIRVIRVPVWGRKDMAAASITSMLSYSLSGFFSFLTKRIKFDIVNTHFSFPTGPLGALIAFFRRKPNVLMVYGADIHDPSRFSPNDSKVLTRINSFLLNQASAVVAESEDIKGWANKFYTFGNDIRIIKLPYSLVAFDSTGWESLGLAPDKTYLVSVGRLVKRKGFGNLLEALAMIEDKSIESLIVGDGPERETLCAQIDKLGLQRRVHLLGHVSNEKKFQYLENSDAFVLSSDHEGFGIVLQEAMQVGLPIVSTNQGGQTDFLTDDRNALLVPPRDPVALAGAIKRICCDGELRRRMGIANRETLKSFDQMTICKEYIEIFEEVLSADTKL